MDKTGGVCGFTFPISSLPGPNHIPPLESSEHPSQEPILMAPESRRQLLAQPAWSRAEVRAPLEKGVPAMPGVGISVLPLPGSGRNGCLEVGGGD